MRRRFLTFISIISLLSLCGCINENPPSKNEIANNYTYTLSYEVELITTDNSHNKTLILPVPLTKEMEPVALLNNLSIVEGNATFGIYDTEFGIGLKIAFTKSFRISAYKEFNNKHDEKYLFYKMSLNVNSTEEYWIYFNSTNNESVILNFNSYEKSIIKPGRGKSPYSYHIYEWELENYTLQKGWQIVKMLKTWEIEG